MADNATDVPTACHRNKCTSFIQLGGTDVSFSSSLLLAALSGLVGQVRWETLTIKLALLFYSLVRSRREVSAWIRNRAAGPDLRTLAEQLGELVGVTWSFEWQLKVARRRPFFCALLFACVEPMQYWIVVFLAQQNRPVSEKSLP